MLIVLCMYVSGVSGLRILPLLTNDDDDGYYNNFFRQFASFYNTRYGNCYTFNSGWNDSAKLREAYRPGPQYGKSCANVCFNFD